MQPFQRILVPTDYSRCSDAALALATSFARKLGSVLTLVHVIDEADQLRATTELAAATRATRHELDARARLAGGVVVHTLVRTGEPWQEILAAAAESRADLIVLGTHGRRGFARMFLGSTAEKVVRLATIPVLTVRGELETTESAP